MEKTLNRRGITARQKEGIYRAGGNEPARGDRQKKQKDHLYYGRTEDPEYQNMQRSMHDSRDEYGSPGWWEIDFIDRREDQKRNRSQNYDRRVFNSRSERIRDDDERNNYQLRRDQNKKDRWHTDLDNMQKWNRDNYGDQRYSYKNKNIYGEHPASHGREEYLGGNKRHPGLLGNRRSYKEEKYWGDDLDIQDEINREKQYFRRQNEKLQPRNHKNDTRLALRDYLNRMQFDTPFHPREIYDPVRSERERERIAADRSDENIYRYEGYGHEGNIEGFGKRGGRQQGHDWLDEDEYRDGHAPRQRGYGKYGSR